jgi:hypothetical protein
MEIPVRLHTLLLAGAAALSLAACARHEPIAEAPPAPPPVAAAPVLPAGAVAGTTAADRDGDGIVDGWYTADGIYHPALAPAAPPPPAFAMRRGERG